MPKEVTTGRWRDAKREPNRQMATSDIPVCQDLGNAILANSMWKRMLASMRNLTLTVTLVFLLGISVFSIQVHSQENHKQGVQGPGQGPDELAGCYQVILLSWNPPDDSVKLIPTRFQLLNVPRVPGATRLGIRSLGAGSERNPIEKLWSWRPKGKDELEIEWSSGLGGYRGKLKTSGSGELVAKMKEYCDYRCADKRRTGSLHLHKIGCEPN